MQSVTLWCDYLNFVQEFDPLVRGCSADGISKARNLFERALTAAGLHFTDGYKIWELYREFEEAILLTIAESDSGVRVFCLFLHFFWLLMIAFAHIWLLISSRNHVFSIQ